MQKTLVVLTGPTGIGKTSLGIKIAQHFNTEIISSDSRQIFKELTIGTAVPDKEELSAVKHHFIQTHSIHENYNASRYEKEALDILSKCFSSKKIILMIGGSMLYIDSICKGIDKMPDADPEIRASLKKELEENGIEGLRLQLKNLDPNYYKTVDLKNPNRIIHALEISLQTGKPYSSFLSKQNKKRPFSIIKIVLNCKREMLHKRINSRVDKMIEAGLEQEAHSLWQYKHLNSLNTVGYREWFAHFNGEISREKAIELIKRNSRRYARKQITWFRKDPTANWFAPSQLDEIIKLIESKVN